MKPSFFAPAIGFVLLAGCADPKGVPHPGLSHDGYGYVKNGPRLPPPNTLIAHMTPQERQALQKGAPRPAIEPLKGLVPHNVAPVQALPQTQARFQTPSPGLSHPIITRHPATRKKARAPHKKPVTPAKPPAEPVIVKTVTVQSITAVPVAPTTSAAPAISAVHVTPTTPEPVKEAPVIDDNILQDGAILSANPIHTTKHKKRHK